MDNERNQRRFESVYSKKVRAGKRRTYFFDVRRTKGDDFYLTLTESTKKFNGEGYERHKIFLYKEDFNRFLTSLEDVVNYVKQELMPDYDYDEYTRRHEEYDGMDDEDDDDNYDERREQRRVVRRVDEEDFRDRPRDRPRDVSQPQSQPQPQPQSQPQPERDPERSPQLETEDDMSW